MIVSGFRSVITLLCLLLKAVVLKPLDPPKKGDTLPATEGYYGDWAEVLPLRSRFNL